jgi:hypothetical protein
MLGDRMWRALLVQGNSWPIGALWIFIIDLAFS